MPNRIDNELLYQAFWDGMAKNSLVVQKMPAWMKGSPVNKRTQLAAKITEKKVTVKTAPIANQ